MSRASKWVKALIAPKLKTDIPLEVNLVSGHTAAAISVKNSAGAEVFSVSAAGAVTPALGGSYADNAFELKDNAAPTKKGAFQLSGVTVGQTRTLTWPDYDGTIATLAGTESLTNKSLTSPKVVTSILDTNGAELLKVTATGTAVNELTLANAAANGAPALSATGDDTNISIALTTKGTGMIVPTVAGIAEAITVTTKNDASDQTLTAAQLKGGLILRDCNGANRQDTLPTAALLVAAIPGAVAGKTAIYVTIRNTSDAAETITVAAGAGGSISGTATIAQNNTKVFLIVLTNVGAGTEAYVAYSMGTATH